VSGKLPDSVMADMLIKYRAEENIWPIVLWPYGPKQNIWPIYYGDIALRGGVAGETIDMS